MPMLKEALSGLLSDEEIGRLSSAFDVIGDIAVIKIPNELLAKQGVIAGEILARMKNVRTVLKQTSDVQGEFRIRQVEFVKGEEKYETIYKENSCLFKVDLRQVYFSPRLATERERVRSLVRDGEKILNMFAGIGTFSIVIAKLKECIIESVDKNPAAIELATESLMLNRKLKGTVRPILGDAGEFAASRALEFDRVIMPLPERSRDFLPAAFESAKKGATIHYYVHVPADDYKDDDWISRHLGEVGLGKEFTIARWKKVREVGPRYVQAVADVIVES